MISHETKRILGTTGILFIVALVVAGALPFPRTGISPVSRRPHTVNPPRALIFSGNFSLTSGGHVFDLSLTRGHQYMWRFNVTFGSMMINLTDQVSQNTIWSVGPGSSGSQYLSGRGVANFNWTAAASGTYQLIFQSPDPAPSLQPRSPILSVCYVQVWDLSALVVVFGSSKL